MCQHVRELVFGANVTALDLGVQINAVKKPIQSNSVGSWNMPHCGTSILDNHFDYRLIVLKDIQHSTRTRMHCVGWNVVNVSGMELCMFGLTTADGFHRGSLLGPSVLFGMKNFNHQIPVSESGNTVHAYTCNEREMISASVELCETEVCFLHIQLLGTNVWLPKMHGFLPDVDFESSRSSEKSECWNSPYLHCGAVFPTWQYCLNSLVWWMYEIKRAKRWSQALVHLVIARANLFTDHKNIRSTNASQIHTFQNNLWQDNRQFSNKSHFFFF